ncbi:hypothetical protein WL88_19545 [Burkholderia diffusa]|uniref:Lipoprotein n=1 Tax=Burkholderia diffusa TaxID=488732 RepID=A0AAW3PFE0_9BURK|nr:DUF3313 domain-containing protein [Burkholderia diffusa]KUZ11658.1 hypothetical protein WI28_17380 [Burkholderia diffusa]KVC42916.1 hypothetical protein WI71_20725 [Burkholderia diffusa]KVH42539.1 hypothetical protein WJ39_29395 [Burkholderia diffusa]KVM92016.1 hypothetical protein WJ62_30195 [Burkholderia diffusa]KWF32373.1 hypothetical protein WL85_22505 [Burkholderia diffusa]
MNRSTASRRLTRVALCVALAGCAGVEPARYTGIESSPYLRSDPQDKSGRVPYRYALPTDWNRYRKLILDPVAIYRGTDNQFGKLSDQDKATLAAYMGDTFARKLGKRFELTNAPAPDTLRVKLTLTGAVTTTAFAGAFAHFDLAGNLYNGVQAIRGREGAFTGSVIYAVEIRDAATNRLINAYVTKQYPNAMNIGASFGALSAAKTGIDKGADALAAQFE